MFRSSEATFLSAVSRITSTMASTPHLLVLVTVHPALWHTHKEIHQFPAAGSCDAALTLSLHLRFGLALSPFLVLWATLSSSQPAPSPSPRRAPLSPAICPHPTSSFHLSPVFLLFSSTYLSSLPFTQRNPFLPSLPLLRLLPPTQVLFHSSAPPFDVSREASAWDRRMGWCIPSCTSYPPVSWITHPLHTMLCVAYKQAQDHILRGSSVETYMQLLNLSIF